MLVDLNSHVHKWSRSKEEIFSEATILGVRVGSSNNEKDLDQKKYFLL